MRQPSPRFRQQQLFQESARNLVRLPRPEESPLDYLLPEARWQELCSETPDPEAWLMALSQATGVYFFPSREWPSLFFRYLRRLRVQRLLEAGAGRGYLTAALASLSRAAGVAFQAVDRGDGEFQAGLPTHPLVQPGNVFEAVQAFQPEVVLYAWPPPGQSLAEICRAPFLRYLMVVGEAGGGATGDPEDWRLLPHRNSDALSRYGRGRTGWDRHRLTIFFGPDA